MIPSLPRMGTSRWAYCQDFSLFNSKIPGNFLACEERKFRRLMHGVRIEFLRHSILLLHYEAVVLIRWLCNWMQTTSTLTTYSKNWVAHVESQQWIWEDSLMLQDDTPLHPKEKPPHHLSCRASILFLLFISIACLLQISRALSRTISFLTLVWFPWIEVAVSLPGRF